MPVFDLFSKRQARKLRAGQPDTYSYDELPLALRTQVAQILMDTIGRYSREYSDQSPADAVWDSIKKIVAREHGVFHLADVGRYGDSRKECIEFLLKGADTSQVLDLVEVAFAAIDTLVRQWHDYDRSKANATQSADDAIEELNSRFQEHAVGYSFIDQRIVRKDSEFIHQEVVRPAIQLLHQAGFSGPEEEFLAAHRFYREGNRKQAVAEALKAFESTMKAICRARNWPYPDNATAHPLIRILAERGIIPPEMESHFAGLRTAMESGLPTISNRTSRHGQGPEPLEVSDHLVAHALHLCASNIVFLVQTHLSQKA